MWNGGFFILLGMGIFFISFMMALATMSGKRQEENERLIDLEKRIYAIETVLRISELKKEQ